MTEEEKPKDVPDEFAKVMKDFIADVLSTFPEFAPMVTKYWKPDNEANSLKFLFKFCKKKYPPRFFDILYQNEDIFKEDSEVDTEFLPFIHFKSAWNFNISAQTKETIWKYLQLITFSIVGSIESKDAFGDTAKLFEAIDNENFKSKIEETMSQLFETLNSKSANEETNASGEEGEEAPPLQMPTADDIHEKINEMMGGKLGALAKEIAEETASNLGIDFSENADMKEVFSKLIKNPTKLMSLVKSAGTKLEDKIKSGEIKESELMQEASEMMNKMKNMPGMGNIQAMLSKMGMGGAAGGGKMNFGAMKSQLDANIRKAKMKERMRAKAEANAFAKPQAKKFSTGEKVQKTPRGTQKPTEPEKVPEISVQPHEHHSSHVVSVDTPLQKPQSLSKKKARAKAAAAASSDEKS